MGYEVGDQLPKNFEELDDIAARVYAQGVDAGKSKLRGDIRDFLTRELIAVRGNERRADQDDPKYQAITLMMEKLYSSFEEGTL